jgi:hypothetical protein
VPLASACAAARAYRPRFGRATSSNSRAKVSDARRISGPCMARPCPVTANSGSVEAANVGPHRTAPEETAATSLPTIRHPQSDQAADKLSVRRGKAARASARKSARPNHPQEFPTSLRDRSARGSLESQRVESFCRSFASGVLNCACKPGETGIDQDPFTVVRIGRTNETTLTIARHL